MRTLMLLFCFLLTVCAVGQVDSAAKAVEDTWMQPRSDGRMFHSLPPPVNVVNGGAALDYAGAVKRDALWLKLVGVGVGAALWTQNEQVGYVVGGLAFSYSMVLDFRSSKSTGEAGRLLRSGYSINERYDLVPDSIDDGARERLIPQRYR